MAELGVFYQPLEVTDPERLEYACQRINQLIGSEVVIVTDRMGVILARTDRRWEVGETFRETTAVARALRGERANTMWVQDGRLYAMVSVPVRLPIHNIVSKGLLDEHGGRGSYHEHCRHQRPA